MRVASCELWVGIHEFLHEKCELRVGFSILKCELRVKIFRVAILNSRVGTSFSRVGASFSRVAFKVRVAFQSASW